MSIRSTIRDWLNRPSKAEQASQELADLRQYAVEDASNIAQLTARVSSIESAIRAGASSKSPESASSPAQQQTATGAEAPASQAQVERSLPPEVAA